MDNEWGSVDQMKWDFLHEEIMSLSISAAFMFACVYQPEANDADRLIVRKGIKAELRKIGVSYVIPVGEDEHAENIVGLAKRLSKNFGPYLRDQRFRIGISQKALNLYLKYLWCLGRIAIPPHCPFDSRIIGLLPPRVRQPFTKVDDIEVYETWVVEARKKAGNRSLAEWELAAFEGLRD